MRYLMLDLPPPVRDLKIAEDLDCQLKQAVSCG
ncbi:hypothetical protein ES703_62018 [subsurface metagenome]